MTGIMNPTMFIADGSLQSRNAVLANEPEFAYGSDMCATQIAIAA